MSGPRTLVVGTAGHIDHGKSTLVTALTGTDPDRLKEEKARGITIELGFAHVALGDAAIVSFVDVPGHERFVRTMLAGAGGVDAVLLVVAADEGVMPQTREHFAICRLLQVERGAVVLTKIDAVDAETLELATLDVRELVAGSFLDGAPIVPVSARTGAGLDELRAVLTDLARVARRRDSDGPARLAVDRVFTMRGFGTVATGTLVAGTLGRDDVVAVLPEGRTTAVRGLHVHGSVRSSAVAGQRVAVNLAGLEVADVPRGAVVATPGSLAATRRLDAEIAVLPDAPALRHGSRVRLHQGTAEILARVSLAGAAGEVPPGGAAFVRLRLERPAVVTRRDRFILRRYSPLVTIGGGAVLDPDPPRAGLRSPRAAARLEALRLRDDREADRRAAAARMIADAGVAGLALDALVPRVGAAPARIRAAVSAVAASGEALLVDGWACDRQALAAPTAALLAGVAAFHAAQPLADGVPLEAARTRWFGAAAPAVFAAVIAELVAAGRIVARETIALAGHRVAPSGDEGELLARLEARFAAGGLQPPDASLAALAAELGRPAPMVERVLQLALRQRRLVRLDTLVFHPDALATLKAEIAARKTAAGSAPATVDVKAFKDTYGISRKFAIPLLEYLDRERVTRRAGDVRIVL